MLKQKAPRNKPELAETMQFATKAPKTIHFYSKPPKTTPYFLKT